MDNPYELYLTKPTYTKGDVKTLYDLVWYCGKIPNNTTITTLPEENANYIREALPNVTDCISMLYACSALTSVDTTGWDTSNVTNMSSMFNICYVLTNLDVSRWNTNNVTNMGAMFGNCWALKTLDLSNWNTSNVTNMNWMFNECESLTTITGVIDMKSCNVYKNMFDGCTKLSGVKIKNPPDGITATSGIGGLVAGKYEIVS